MIILNFGIPRSGTVLVNAIIRRLLQLHNHRLVLSNPHGEQIPRAIRKLVDAGVDRFGVGLVHTHTWDETANPMLARSPWVMGFANYRDPRDVCVSLMKLHDHDFDAAAGMTINAFKHFDMVTGAYDLMILPYEFLIADTPGHIYQIARRLGLTPGHDQVAQIYRDTSQDTHRAVMHKVRAGEVENLRRLKNKNRVLVEDSRTLINDRHIQSGASGRWREELTKADQARAAEVFKPLLVRFGYDLHEMPDHVS